MNDALAIVFYEAVLGSRYRISKISWCLLLNVALILLEEIYPEPEGVKNFDNLAIFLMVHT